MTLNMLIIAASTIFLTYYTAALPSTTKTYGVRFCIVFNAFVCFTLYNATFAGNNLMTSLDAHKETLSETIPELSRLNATLIVRDISHLMGYANQFFFGTETPNDLSITVLPTKQEVVARLCADDNAIYFDYLRDFVEFYNDDVGASVCTLTTVTNDLNVEDKYTIGVNLGKASPIVNYYRADRIRKRKQLEFVILGLFNSEKFDNYWFPRYMGRPANIPPVPPPKFAYFQFSLGYLSIFFSILAVGFALSVIALGAEIAWHKHQTRIARKSLAVPGRRLTKRFFLVIIRIGISLAGMAVQVRFLADSFTAPEYDCSAHTPEEWTELYGEQQTLIGVWSVVFSTMCQILYLPSLRVFFRERKLTCYKIMFLLALADYGGITGVGSLFVYTMLKGYVMCSDFTLSLIMGLIICCCWYVSTGSCALLVINRISEMMQKPALFQGWRSSLAMVIIVIYGIMVTLFTRLVYPNSPHTTVAFESFIPGHTVEEYPNNANMMHNFAVSFVIPNLYIVLCTVIRSQSNRAQVSNTTQALQANVFYQASIICFFNVTTAAAWLIQMFVPTPQFIITAGMITIQSVHGLPCIIYLVFNRSVRKELWKLLSISGERIATISISAGTSVKNSGS